MYAAQRESIALAKTEHAKLPKEIIEHHKANCGMWTAIERCNRLLRKRERVLAFYASLQ